MNSDKITNHNKMKFSKLTYLIILSGVIVVAGTVSYTLADPLTQLVINPGSTLGGKGTQIAMSFKSAQTTTVTSIEVKFPAGTVVSVAEFADVVITNPTTGAQLVGTNLGTTTFTDSGGLAPTLIYTFTTPVSSPPAGADWFVFITKVRNPDIVGIDQSFTTTVTTKNGGSTIDTLGATYSITQLYNGNKILSAINSVPGDICIGTGC